MSWQQWVVVQRKTRRLFSCPFLFRAFRQKSPTRELSREHLPRLFIGWTFTAGYSFCNEICPPTEINKKTSQATNASDRYGGTKPPLNLTRNYLFVSSRRLYSANSQLTALVMAFFIAAISLLDAIELRFVAAM